MQCFGRAHLVGVAPHFEFTDVPALLSLFDDLMFLLSKLLPLLLLPLGIALLLLIWGAARGSRWPGISALAALWIFSTPLISEALWRGLEWPYVRRPSARLLEHPRPAAVVVLGTGRHPAPGPARASEWLDADRFFAGIEAYSHFSRQDEAPRLIFTGGWWPTMPSLPPEGDVLRELAIGQGIPANAVFSTSKVRNTADEAIAVAAMLPADSTVLLVTSAFHMSRAQRLFQRQGLSVLPFPVDFQASGAWAGNLWSNPLNLVPTAKGLESSSRAIRETIGRTLYRAW